MSTKNPRLQKKPARKELKGKVPTSTMYKNWAAPMWLDGVEATSPGGPRTCTAVVNAAYIRNVSMICDGGVTVDSLLGCDAYLEFQRRLLVLCHKRAVHVL